MRTAPLPRLHEARPLQGTTLHIEPLHLSVTQTFQHDNSHNLHVLQDPDIAVGAGSDVLCSARAGRFIVALGVDDDHDEVHYDVVSDADAPEMLQRAVEALTVALAAVEKTYAGVGR